MRTLWRSLRWRVVLACGLASGLALLAAGLGLWSWSTHAMRQRHEFELERRTLRTGIHLLAEMSRSGPGGRIEAVQHATEALKDAGLAYAWYRREGRAPTVLSDDWPAELRLEDWIAELPAGREPLAPGEMRDRPPPPPDRVLMKRFGRPKPGWRVAALPGPRGWLFLAQSLEMERAERRGLGMRLTVACGTAWILAMAGAFWAAGRALRPVAGLVAAVNGIDAAALDRRLDVRGHAVELERLTAGFNALLDRLQRSFGQARRFSADAAHELNTPLTVLQAGLDEALRVAPADSEVQRRVADLLEEVRRLRDLVDRLLLLARADAGGLQPQLREVELGALLHRLVEDARDLDPALRWDLEFPPTPIAVRADPELLRQALFNLLANAVRHNRAGGWVRCRLSLTGATTARVEVRNSGEAIPAESLPLLFQRFHRADRARLRGGLGLGLSLAREFARACGGEIHLVENQADAIAFALDVPRLINPAGPGPNGSWPS